jgi:uncharacterized membrane protein
MFEFGFYKLNFILYLICVVWFLLLIVAPASIPSDTIDLGDDGMVGMDEHFDTIETIQNPMVEAIYHSGDSMCHLKNSRSLFINSNQMPYCARDVGIFFGFVVGAGIAVFVKVDLKWWLLVIGLVPIGLDGGIQLITSYESNNVLRIITGSLAGIVTMLALGLIIIELSQDIKVWLINRAWAEKFKRQSKDKSNKT